MPIKGLTDEKSFDLNRAMPRIGKLRKGDVKGERRPGKDLDYFRVTFEEEFEHFADDFKALYGKKPKVFNEIKFIANDVDNAFETWYETYDSKQTLLTRCDGEIIHVEYMPKSGEWRRWVDGKTAKVDCGHDEDGDGCGECSSKGRKPQRVGRLRVVLTEFTYRTGAYGYFEIDTHSIHDIISLYNGLRFLYQEFNTLTGIPFILGRSARKISTPMGKDENGIVKRGKTEKSLLYIRPAEKFVKQELLAAPQPTMQVLPAPTIEPEEGRKLLATGGNRRLGSGSNGNGSEPEESEIVDVETEIVDDEPAQETVYENWQDDPTQAQVGKEWQENAFKTYTKDVVIAAAKNIEKSDYDSVYAYTIAIEDAIKAARETEKAEDALVEDAPPEETAQENKPDKMTLVFEQVKEMFSDRPDFDVWVKANLKISPLSTANEIAKIVRDKMLKPLPEAAGQ